MLALCAALGGPQERFRSLHVVGTNGKSSVTTMTAALLEGTGLRTGAIISPHVWRWSERTRIGGEEIAPEPFAAAVARVAATIPAVEAGLDEGRITQFEATIAASFVAFAAAGVDVAMVEAGLGGRLDATNVIPSSATALTSVGLDHVEWLGDNELAIATEKLAVLRPGTTLVLGDVSAPVAALARATAAERGARVLEPARPGSPLLRAGRAAYLERNARLALTLAETIAGPIEPDRARAGLASLPLRGRAETLPGEPPLLLDAAHNAQGARALAEALPALSRRRPVIACLSILAGKDVAGIIAALAPALAGAICCAAEPGPAMGRPGAHATDPSELAAALRQHGIEAEAVPDPERALERACALAGGRGGVALCAGSHYLLRYAWTARRAQSS